MQVVASLKCYGPLVCYAKTGLQALAAVSLHQWNQSDCLSRTRLFRGQAPLTHSRKIAKKAQRQDNTQSLLLDVGLSSKGSKKQLGMFRVSAFGNITQTCNCYNAFLAVIDYHSRFELCFRSAYTCHFSGAKHLRRRALVDQAMDISLLMRCMSSSKVSIVDSPEQSANDLLMQKCCHPVRSS
jgi:hypothetical protein